MGVDLIDRAMKVHDALMGIDKLNREMREVEQELSRLLKVTISLTPLPKTAGAVEVKIPERALREVELAPLRCRERIEQVDTIVMENDVIRLEGRYFSIGVRLSNLRVEDLLMLACNLTDADLDALANAIIEKRRELEEDVKKLKELVTYAKLVLS